MNAPMDSKNSELHPRASATSVLGASGTGKYVNLQVTVQRERVSFPTA